MIRRTCGPLLGGNNASVVPLTIEADEDVALDDCAAVVCVTSDARVTLPDAPGEGAEAAEMMSTGQQVNRSTGSWTGLLVLSACSPVRLFPCRPSRVGQVTPPTRTVVSVTPSEAALVGALGVATGALLIYLLRRA